MKKLTNEVSKAFSVKAPHPGSQAKPVIPNISTKKATQLSSFFIESPQDHEFTSSPIYGSENVK